MKTATIANLPDEMLAVVFGWLSCVQVTAGPAQACHRLRAICLDPSIRGLCVFRVTAHAKLSPLCLWRALKCATIAGHLPCVRHLCRKAMREKVALGGLIHRAAQYGHADILQWLMDMGYDACESTFVEAAERGHLSCLRRLYEHNSTRKWAPGILHIAVANGHAECADYIRRQNRADYVCRRSPNGRLVGTDVSSLCATLINGCATCFEAAQRGHTRCLVRLTEAGCPCDARALAVAVANGHTNCVDRILLFADGPWSLDAPLCTGPATAAHLLCVEKVVAAGVRPGASTDLAAVRAGHVECMRRFESANRGRDNWCTIAARRGDLAMLRYLYENGRPWSDVTLAAAIESARVECIAYVLANDCPWTVRDLACLVCDGLWRVFASAARPDPADGSPSLVAASLGRVDILRDAHARGWPCDPRALLEAVRVDSVDCLAYLYQQGCPWDERVSREALGCGSRRCFKYAVAHGCPVNPADLATAHRKEWWMPTSATDGTQSIVTGESGRKKRRRRRRRKTIVCNE
ncbi:Ankyrin repeat domain containing protein [Pandoravirus neocaledonia]|uniref:Ankyrin repeat domain containing protein n=1 Tax=Pandoravirus neocaledonia TaxID=2107708 RepID=A0A2U7UE86_9VIRU|nr:Ankyrin repeat domain containing protein [Pandoravirus neocaledonia]AVK76630.1 Ankyrin repeat domain containing protein [Pandoravirus neocaledonia]